MGWRSELEDKYTVVCKGCKRAKLDYHKKPNQKYIIGEKCSICEYIHPKNHDSNTTASQGQPSNDGKDG